MTNMRFIIKWPQNNVQLNDPFYLGSNKKFEKNSSITKNHFMVKQ